MPRGGLPKGVNKKCFRLDEPWKTDVHLSVGNFEAGKSSGWQSRQGKRNSQPTVSNFHPSVKAKSLK